MKKIGQAWNWFWYFLSNQDKGMSMKRIVTASIVFCIVHLHYRFVDASNAVDVLKLDDVFVCVLLGLVALPDVLKIFTGKEKIEDKKDESNS